MNETCRNCEHCCEVKNSAEVYCLVRKRMMGCIYANVCASFKRKIVK